MKKIIIILFAFLGLGACSYLDISPDLGLSEEDVFTKVKEYKAFLNAAYDGTGKRAGTKSDNGYLNLLYGSFPLRMDANAYRYAFVTMPDTPKPGSSARS